MSAPLPLSATPSILVIGDRVDGPAPAARPTPPWPARDMPREREALLVEGGYLERLPLACIAAGIVEMQWIVWRAVMPR